MRTFPWAGLAGLVLRPALLTLGVSGLMAFALHAPPAGADTIYQYRDAQGHVVLSDQKPPSSARQVKVRTNVADSVNGPSPIGGGMGSGVPLPSQVNTPMAPDTSGTGLSPSVSSATGDASLDAFNRRQAEKAKTQADNEAAVSKAQADLDQALADQKAGQQLKPDEQTYAGYAQTYEQRQQALTDAVSKAQAALLNAQVSAKP